MNHFEEKIKTCVQHVSAKWKDQAVGPLNLLPLHIQGEIKELIEVVSRWLTERGPGVALLTGPLGSGKTIASCQIPEQLVIHPAADFKGAVLWVPFRDTNLFLNDPDDSIKKLLRITDDLDIWDRQSNVRCIILDGIDEAISVHGYDTAMRWLSILFDRADASACKPRIMICGRDSVLAKSIMDSRLDDKIKSYCDSYCTIPMDDSAPLVWKIKAWDDDTPWRIMREWLTDKWGLDAATELTHHINQELLSSPLLFGLACDVLKEIGEIRDGGGSIDLPFFSSEWTLTSFWIDRINQRNTLKYSLGTDSQSRRYAAQEIALFLALTDHGTSGVKIDELKKMEQAGLNSLTNDFWKNNAFELKSACLLREYNDCLTIFHEVILIHLAAEALDRLSKGSEETNEVEIAHHYGSSWWDRFAARAELPGLRNLKKIIDQLVTIKALQPGSIFTSVIHYWLRHTMPPDKLTISKSALFEPALNNTLTDSEALDDNYQSSMQFLGLFRNSALRCLSDSKSTIPVIHVFTEVLESQKIHQSVKKLLDDQKSSEAVEISLINNSNSFEKKYFLPASSVAEAQALADSLQELLAEEDNNIRTQLNQEPFQNYLIQRLYVDTPEKTRYELEDIASSEMIKDIIRKVMVEENEDNVNVAIRANAVLLKFNKDGTTSNIDAGMKLEQAGICSNDALVITETVEEMIQLGTSNGIPPSPPASLNLRAFKKDVSVDGFQMDENDEHRMIKIPDGRMPVWRNVEGFRKIFLTTIKQAVYISERLVTVDEYADFLKENPEMRKPDQPTAGWMDNGSHIVHDSSAKALPVTGISRKEAEAYLKWFGEKYRAVMDKKLHWWFRLPDPEWLQIAALGSQLGELSSDGRGPFGHKDITGRCWQWTGGHQGDAALVFGGGFMEEKEAGMTRKILEQHYPDLCRGLSPNARDPNVGFRICIVDLSE